MFCASLQLANYKKTKDKDYFKNGLLHCIFPFPSTRLLLPKIAAYFFISFPLAKSNELSKHIHNALDYPIKKKKNEVPSANHIISCHTDLSSPRKEFVNISFIGLQTNLYTHIYINQKLPHCRRRTL